MKKFVFILGLSFICSLFAEGIPHLPLRGQGSYKWFFLPIYDAKLWADKGDNLYLKPLLLELKYRRSLKGKDIVDQSIKELVNSGTSQNELDLVKLKLLEIFPDVKAGDAIQADYAPEVGVIFFLNSTKELGRLSDLSLSKKFLDIWLGEKTSAPELRNELLGKNK